LTGIARYIPIIHKRGYLESFQTGYFFLRNDDMVFKETTNDDFILPSKTCKGHLKTTVANVCHLVQSD